MIDVHAHIQQFQNVFEVLKRAKSVGVEKVVSAGVNLEDSMRCVEVARRYEMVLAAAGLHPTEELSQIEAVLNLIENTPDLVAVGEIGLDWKFGRREEQIEPFRKQIEIARELDLPVIVHSRSAGKYVLEIMEKMGVEKAVLHSFDGALRYARRGFELGYHFSIPVTVLVSRQKQELAENVPLELLLLESDSPALSPFEGENEPANLIHSLQLIAELREMEPKELDKITTENAKKLFRI